MIELEDCRRLLALHAQAYDALLRVSEAAAREPALLDAAGRTELSDATTCLPWLQSQANLWAPLSSSEPADHRALGHLFASGFRDSFDVEVLEWDGRTLDATVKARRSSGRGNRPHARKKIETEAVKRLARWRGRRLDWKDAQRVASAKSIADALTLWTWVFELMRRAEGRVSELGAVLWRAMPTEHREDLTAERVIAARDRVLDRIAEID